MLTWRILDSESSLHTCLEILLTNVFIILNIEIQVVWFEAMSNPQLRIADVRAISNAVHEFNEDIVVCVDNTFLTPFNVVRKLTFFCQMLILIG